jgi:hypothetical protein
MDIQESMQRILERRGGMEEPLFYAVFFERHPEYGILSDGRQPGIAGTPSRELWQRFSQPSAPD